MARPTLTTHPKFAALAKKVRSRALARGILELIWEAAYASGDPVIGGADAVEAIADWRGKPGALATMLSEKPCKFLDRRAGRDANGVHLHGVFVVHDLEDHAPRYVQKRMMREAERRVNGESIRKVRQRAASARWSKSNADGHANGRPPAPAPAPAPARSKKRAARAGAARSADPEGSRDVVWLAETWYEQYVEAWKAKYPAPDAHCGNVGDGQYTWRLQEFLDGMELGPRLAAQARASAMFAEFVGEDSERARKARHPWSWFVTGFGQLATQALPAAGTRQIRDEVQSTAQILAQMPKVYPELTVEQQEDLRREREQLRKGYRRGAG